MDTIGFDDFLKVEMRVGTVVSALPFPKARKPAYRLMIDFGPELGVKQSSAQITGRYRPEELVGMQVIAVVNFPAKQIANVISEVLVLGVETDTGVVLLRPGSPVPDGSRIS